MEEIVPGDTIFWVGGDGSTREYVPAGTNVWKAPNVIRPDSITRTVSGAIAYTRHGMGGLRVEFDGSGRHVATVNRLGHRTSFEWDGALLQRIVLPLPTPATTHRYDFGYSGEPGVLTSVLAVAGGTARSVTIAHVGSTTRVASIQDPDPAIPPVQFGYNGAGTRITSRTDRRGTITGFAYDAGGKLASVTVDPAGLALTTTIHAQETRGLAPVAVDTSAAYTFLDGPRPDSDVLDHSRFWLDRFGAPRRIRDALGSETVLLRENAAFPALVTEVRHPNGFVQQTTYDALGNVETATDVDPLGTGQDAITSYTYGDSNWRNFPTRIQSPAGIVEFGYHPQHGSRTWQQDERGPAGRVSFQYGGPTHLLSAVDAPLSPPATYSYDALGNLAENRSPMGYLTLVERDAMGRDTVVYTPTETGHTTVGAVKARGNRQRTSYDAAGRPHVVTTWGPSVTAPGAVHPADSVWVTNLYDDEHNLVQTTRRFPRRIADADTVIVNNQTVHTYWTYDRANRLESHAPSGGAFERYTVDPAGNVTAVRTRRGDTIRSSYDELGRLVERVVPGLWFPETTCWDNPNCLTLRFPTLESRPGVCIPADTARFAYDIMGRMTRADNMYARIGRTYTRNGLITSDTLRVRTYYRSAAVGDCPETEPAPDPDPPDCPDPTQPCDPGGDPQTSGGVVMGGMSGGDLEADFDRHVYVVNRTYDLAGRPLTLSHPLGGGQQSYTYGAGGVLASVTAPGDHVVAFHHDDALRLWRTDYPGGATRQRAFDNDGRVVEDALAAMGGGIGATLDRDAQGRVVSGSVQAGDGSLFDVDLWYNGLGAVVAAWGVSGHSTHEEMTVDAIGNRVRHRVMNALPNHTDRIRHLNLAAERLLRVDGDPFVKPYPAYNYVQEYVYDGSGNIIRTFGHETQQCGGEICRIDDEAVSYYGADDKLRVYNRHVGLVGASHPGGVYEEYRYDALGRRVMTRSRSTAQCLTQACESYIERVAWDGDQVIMEIRAPGRQGATAAQLDNDHAVGQAADHWLHGRVRYTHGGGIDAPLTIIRENMQGFPALAVAPHTNWQGDFEVGTTMDGQLTTACAGCPPISWPGHQTTADGESTLAGPPASWFGSLIGNKTDGSGLQYMRNRYYDPKTGRFTQEDPIGLAGGMNLYGFAGGDPINYWDPFGLSALDCPACPQSGALRPGGFAGAFLNGVGQNTARVSGYVEARVAMVSGRAAVSQDGLSLDPSAAVSTGLGSAALGIAVRLQAPPEGSIEVSLPLGPVGITIAEGPSGVAVTEVSVGVGIGTPHIGVQRNAGPSQSPAPPTMTLPRPVPADASSWTRRQQ